MKFVIEVLRDGAWVDVAGGEGNTNRYVRTAVVAAIPMNEPFRVMSDEGPAGPAPRLLGTGDAGSYLVLDDGTPRAAEGRNFRATHVQVPAHPDDDIAQLRITIERMIASRVLFEDDQAAGELADLIFGAIAALEVKRV